MHNLVLQPNCRAYFPFFCYLQLKYFTLSEHCRCLVFYVHCKSTSRQYLPGLCVNYILNLHSLLSIHLHLKKSISPLVVAVSLCIFTLDCFLLRARISCDHFSECYLTALHPISSTTTCQHTFLKVNLKALISLFDISDSKVEYNLNGKLPSRYTFTNQEALHSFSFLTHKDLSITQPNVNFHCL